MMSTNHRIIATLTLGLVAVVMIGFARRETSAPDNDVASPSFSDTATPSETSIRDTNTAARPWPREVMRDIFASVGDEVVVAPAPAIELGPDVDALAHAKLRVQGILYSGGTSQAIVNGKALRVGDSIEGFSVVRINADSIVVEHAGMIVDVSLDRQHVP